ncbi:MAG: lantibiotic dehydratase family protein [Prevotellaceae bacterium]|nr:lantibiotic dehydratase family protein [Prevotellaceae bacterium]
MYSSFNQFFVRTPRFPFNFLENESFEAKIKNLQVQEAIYIASPVLYAELQKYLACKIADKEETKRIKSSLYRYVSRMSSRCTPFGLFAGCLMGIITEDRTHIVSGDFNRRTRLDMYFLCMLSQELSKQPDIRENIKYYPNTTLYRLGKNYRYVEYLYLNSRRMHQISSVERSVYLDNIIRTAQKGVRLDELRSYLVNERIGMEDASAFIEDLIDSQLIVNELNPSVTGDDYFTSIIRILENSGINNLLTASIKNIQQTLYHIDFCQGNNHPEPFQSIIKTIKEIKIPYEEKYLFQVDMTESEGEAMLGSDIVKELQLAMTFLNKITPISRNETLDKFRQDFYNRYEDREIPLMEALDSEIGIGYPSNSGSGNISPLLENFYLPGQDVSQTRFQPDVFTSVLFKKAMDALKRDKKEIVLGENDVKNITASWNDLPPTLYTIFKILKTGLNPLIQLNGFFGTCGANLFARFAHTDECITRFVKDIVTKEQELMPDTLFAEIAHLPDSRVGNILSRPHIRNYEILYLANSNLPESQLIYMFDLYLSVKQGKICLRSKRLNREIIPRLTNAHNYKNNPMPVYRFLCDMQLQHGRGGLFFNWGYLNNELNFLPRIRYGNAILSAATWKIPTEEMKHLFAIKEDNKLIAETGIWREKHALPPKMLLPDGDNELFVDWENVQSVQALFSIIKKRPAVSFREFLYDPENSAVRDKDGNPYINECIVAFYKEKQK